MDIQKCPNCGGELPPDSPQGICPKCLLMLGLTDKTETNWEGKQVSRFKILKQVGKGGMGEVYLAEDTSLGRQVALKFLPDSLRDDEVARKRSLASHTIGISRRLKKNSRPRLRSIQTTQLQGIGMLFS